MSNANKTAPAEGTFRLSMAWLHTWGGLLAGWALFVIFLTGALGVFDKPITHWMKPEQADVKMQNPEDMSAEQRAEYIRQGQRYLHEVKPESHFWGIGLPSQDSPQITLFWQDDDLVFHSEQLNPATGKPFAAGENRETEGGHHFVHMHYEFHAGTLGIWIVGFFAMAMLVALVSGIIIHKRIFKDFFTFRSAKGRRSWLDAHNASSVLTLPFHLMIAYTGLATFVALYMPAGVIAHYDTPEQFYAELQQEPDHRPMTGQKAELTDLGDIFTKAEQEMGTPAYFINVEHVGDSSATTNIFGLYDEDKVYGQLLQNTSGKAIVDATSGESLHVEQPGPFSKGNAFASQRVMQTLHFANYGGFSVRWLYFFLGLTGAGMMATGALLFMVKRRERSLNEFGAQTQRVYRAIEVINIATISGLAIACIGYFWANRLLPVGLDERAGWEIQTFFFIWLAAFVHAALRPARQGWIEQWLIFSLLALALPVLNALTTGQHVLLYLWRGDWMAASVELTAIFFGLAGLWLVRYLRNKPVKQRQANAIGLRAQEERG